MVGNFRYGRMIGGIRKLALYRYPIKVIVVDVF